MVVAVSSFDRFRLLFFVFFSLLAQSSLSRRRAVGPHRYGRLFLGANDGCLGHGVGGGGTAGEEGEEDEGQTAEHASLMFLTALR